MKDLISIVKTTDYTLVLIFAVFMLAVILMFELHDKHKKQSELYYFNGNKVENDYDPIAFRIIFAIAAIILFTTGVIIYNLTK